MPQLRGLGSAKKELAGDVQSQNRINTSSDHHWWQCSIQTCSKQNDRFRRDPVESYITQFNDFFWFQNSISTRIATAERFIEKLLTLHNVGKSSTSRNQPHPRSIFTCQNTKPMMDHTLESLLLHWLKLYSSNNLSPPLITIPYHPWCGSWQCLKCTWKVITFGLTLPWHLC